MSSMSQVLTPDQIIESILNSLSVQGFNGIEPFLFWDFVKPICSKLDDFTRKMIWSWLLNESNFEIVKLVSTANKSEKEETNNFEKVDKKDYIDFDKLLDVTNAIRIKSNHDYQSLFLSGVKASDNILGKYPYQLLLIIAKHKEEGINSVDLISESGQDKRSLTSRLQILEENALIFRANILVNGNNISHLTHFHYAKSGTQISSISADIYDRFQIILYIMDTLKNADNNIRIAKDILEEVRQTQPGLTLRGFNGILRFLMVSGFIQMVEVEHSEVVRIYTGLKYVKDLPPSSKHTELLEQIRSFQDIDSQLVNREDEEDEDSTPLNFVNRFLPTVNQLYDTIKSKPGIRTPDLETHLFGVYRSRQFMGLLSTISDEKPDVTIPLHIVRQFYHSGKQRFYRLTTQNYINRNDINYKEEPITAVLDSNVYKSFLEVSSEYSFNSYKRRQAVVEVTNKNGVKYELVWWGSGKAKKIQSLIGDKQITDYSGTLHSCDNLISIKIMSKTVQIIYKNIEQMKGRVGEEIKEMNKLAEEMEYTEHEIKEQEKTVKDIEQVMKNIYGNVQQPENFENPQVSALNNPSAPFLDYGPKTRRLALLSEIEKNKCVCVSSAFCKALSKSMKLDYLIDRRTLLNDAKLLVKEGHALLEIVQGNRHVVKSVKSPPTEEEINNAVLDATKQPNVSSGKRQYSGKVSFDHVTIVNKELVKPPKTKRELIAMGNRTKRLKSALQALETNARLSQISEPLPRLKLSRPERRSLKKRSKVNQAEEFNDIVDDEEKEDKGKEIGDLEVKVKFEEDLLLPIMAKRKRKKFKPRPKLPNTSQVPAIKKSRTNISIEDEHVLPFIRAVVVTQSLSVGSTIDWPRVSSIFEERYTPEMLRRQWPKHKKMLGQRNLQQAKKNWEISLLKAISEGVIKEGDLEEYDIHKMLDVWKSEGAEFFTNRTEFAIYRNYDDNFKDKVFKRLVKESGIEVFRDPPSLTEKEQIWTVKNFTYSLIDKEAEKLEREKEFPTELQVAKTKLKALFATGSEKFSSEKVRTLFSQMSKQLYTTALTELEDVKAIAFLGEESKIKFTLTDKLMLVLETKLDKKFCDDATRIYEILKEAKNSKQGILLSTSCPSGCYAPLFTFIANNWVRLTRVDQKPPTPESYSTKSQDRSKLESDFILSNIEIDKEFRLNDVPLPIGAPCSYIWVDLVGDFNKDIWLKGIYVILWLVVFHPGVPIEPLYDRIYPFLEPFEIKKMLDYLVDRGSIKIGSHGGYWASSLWYLTTTT